MRSLPLFVRMSKNQDKNRRASEGPTKRVVSVQGALLKKNLSFYPPVPRHASNLSWKKVPLAPILSLSIVRNAVTLVWNELATVSMVPKYALVDGYEPLVCRGQTLSGDAWEQLHYFKAGRLPMRCKLIKRKWKVVYNFALLAIDEHLSCAPCTVVKMSPPADAGMKNMST